MKPIKYPTVGPRICRSPLGFGEDRQFDGAEQDVEQLACHPS